MPEYEIRRINVVQKIKGKVRHQWSKGRTCEKKCKKRNIIVVQWRHMVYVVHVWPNFNRTQGQSTSGATSVSHKAQAKRHRTSDCHWPNFSMGAVTYVTLNVSV